MTLLGMRALGLEPQPPYRYFLVTQVFTAGGEYICTQLLGIDLRAVRREQETPPNAS